MNKNLFLRLCLMIALGLYVSSCRNDYVQDQSSTKISSASKFRTISLKDIPEVSHFIQKKTGREDLQVNILSGNTAKSFELSGLQLTDIAEKTEGDTTYYVFGIDSPDADNKTVYNLEVKKVQGIIERADIITYHSAEALSDDPKTRFDYFTGTVSSMDLEGKVGNEVDYNDGIGDCPPDSGTPGGNGDTGTGNDPGDTPPPNGGWNDGGADGTVPWSDNPTDCTDLVLDNQGNTLGWYNHCTGSYYPNANKNASGGYTKLTADCDGNGSGVIVTNPTNPCEKMKTQNTATFKNKINDLKSKLTLKKETGYTENNTGTFTYKDNASATENANALALPHSDVYKDIKGYIHTHPNDFEDSDGNKRIGFKIFSPADVMYFNAMVRNALQNGLPITDVYAVMVSGTGTYQIRFTGNANQIKTIYANTDEDYNKMYINYFQENNDRSDEMNFLKFMDEQMYVKGVSLVKMNDNGTFTIKTLNSDKSGVVDSDCPH